MLASLRDDQPLRQQELGGERAAIEAQIKELSKSLRIRIIGPNCIGMFNGENRLDCAFQGHARMIRPKNGNVAFLSQSGTVGIAFMESSDSFGMSKMISYGNRSDVDEADMIWYLSEDPQTKVIGLYVEGLGDGSDKNFFARLFDSIKRAFTGESMFSVIYKNPLQSPARVAFATPTIGRPFSTRRADSW